MSPRKLTRAVAIATGESKAEIRRRGFGLADPDRINFDPEPCDLPPQILDWDAVDESRPRLLP